MNPFYQSALEIAHRKLFRDQTPTYLHSPRLGTGGGFEDIFLWDTVFSVQWAKYHPKEYYAAESLDNFYKFQEPSGFISRQIHSNGKSKWDPKHPVAFAPPLFSWIELDLHTGNFIPGRLEKVYDHLVRLHEFNHSHYTHPSGLYYSDPWGCGMDDIPRWDTPSDITEEGGIPITRDCIPDPGEKGDKTFRYMKESKKFHFFWNKQLVWVDTCCQVAFDALNISRIATILGKTSDAAKYKAEHDHLADLINETCWDEKTGFYYDRLGDRLLTRRHVGAFWAMIGEVATDRQMERLTAKLEDPAEFGRPCGVPSLSAADPGYGTDSTHYWTGPVWCPTMYMVLRGLRARGAEQLARQLAQKFYNATKRVWEKTGTIWENYSAEQCEQQSPAASPDFCGWSALAPISIFREFIENEKI